MKTTLEIPDDLFRRAKARDELRQKGRPIPENDIWIAALARQHRQTVVSRDGHFDYVPDLQRITW